MEIVMLKTKIGSFLSKYKFVALILLLGICLMLLPNKKKDQVETVNNTEHQAAQSESLEERLEQILSHVDGAGKVRVLLRQGKGERTIYQTDTDESSSDSGSSNSVKTVMVTDANRNENGLVVQVESPVYLGAVVVSEGADSPTVKLALATAVSKMTGIGVNQITVLKMK